MISERNDARSSTQRKDTLIGKGKGKLVYREKEDNIDHIYIWRRAKRIFNQRQRGKEEEEGKRKMIATMI